MRGHRERSREKPSPPTPWSWPSGLHAVGDKSLSFTAPVCGACYNSPRELLGWRPEDRWSPHPGCRSLDRGQRAAAGEGSGCLWVLRLWPQDTLCASVVTKQRKSQSSEGQHQASGGGAPNTRCGRAQAQVRCLRDVNSVIPELMAVSSAETCLPGLLRCSVTGGATKARCRMAVSSE